MPRFRTGVVSRVLEERAGLIRALIRVGGAERRAAAFPAFTGTLAPGDRVVVNTVAVDLGLGSGGEDFVLWNLGAHEAGEPSGGHIVKLRYTPWQADVAAAEAPESPHHAALADAESIDGMPVVACGLHSHVAPAAAMLKRAVPRARVAYVMTDGAALPIAVSDLVAALKERGLVDVTLTCGHAFGGDLECVNLFSALAAARRVGAADAAIVSVGPGVVGTCTALGHSGMDQGLALSAAGALGGRPVAVLRMSFADPRERHRVVSHHTLTALRLAAFVRAAVAVPRLDPARLALVTDRLEEAGIAARHEVRVVEAGGTRAALDEAGLRVASMGRTPDDDPAFFEAAGAGGLLAASLLAEGEQ